MLLTTDDTLKNLALLRMALSYDKYSFVLRVVFDRMGIRFVKAKQDDETELYLKEYLRRKYQIGGKRLEEAVEVIRKNRTVSVNKVKELLGELKIEGVK